jgi:hypothetical protein
VLTNPENENLSTTTVKTPNLAVTFLCSDFFFRVHEHRLITLKSFKSFQFTTVKPDYNETARDGIFFSAAGRFSLTQVLEIWVLGTVTLFRSRQVSVMTRFRLRQVCNRFGNLLMLIVIKWLVNSSVNMNL